MAVVSKDELLNSLRSRFGDDTSDETIKIIEDVSDTISDYETKTADQTNWKQKYEENDAEWRNKYTERFYNQSNETTPDEETDIEDSLGDEKKPLTFDDLFTVKE